MKYILNTINTIICGVAMSYFLILVIPDEDYMRGYVTGCFLMMVYYLGFMFINDNNKLI